MPRSRPPYPAEFRRQRFELVRAGHDPTGLARKVEPSAQAIRNWVAEADRREGRRETKLSTVDPGLTAAEGDELVRLRRENRQLKLERDSLVCAGGRGSAVGVFRFTSANQTDFAIAVMARTLGVSKAGYYA